MEERRKNPFSPLGRRLGWGDKKLIQSSLIK